MQFTRVSEQAKENFYDLSEKIKEVNGLPDGSEKIFRSIQDEGTFIILFPAGHRWPVTVGPNQRFFYPSDQCDGNACLVLCQDYEGRGTVSCSQLLVQVLKDVTVAQPWVNTRTDDEGLRRVLLTIKKSEEKITVSGGNELVSPEMPDLSYYP
jgi:hypothetical protein